jgi:hypothetical protein
MAKSVDSTLLALLATLEERARKNGEKSIIKSVIGRLSSDDANDHLIAEIAALRPKKAGAAKSVAETKAPRKSDGKAGVDVTKATKPQIPAAAS